MTTDLDHTINLIMAEFASRLCYRSEEREKRIREGIRKILEGKKE